MSYHVYILQSTNNHHYIGYTSDLEHRIYQHNNKHHGSTYRILEKWTLVISHEYPTKKEAMEVEKKQVKKHKTYLIIILFFPGSFPLLFLIPQLPF